MKDEKGKLEGQGGELTRREFVAASTAVSAAFTIVPSSVLGRGAQLPPSDRINVASIGVGDMGMGDLNTVMRLDDAQIVAVCDVAEVVDYSKQEFGGTAGRSFAVAAVEEYYAEQMKSGTYAGCKAYVDFREMLEQEAEIDAVIVATPDHVHAAACMAAINRGMHVYCEKPLAHSVHEVRLVTEAARDAGVATQMGNHGHSGEGIRLMVEWIRAGAIGPVREVHGWTGVGRRDWTGMRTTRPEPQPVPPGLDWDLWLGPAEERPYNAAYAPYNWRGWWDFGTGAIGDMACHNLDPAFWALNLGAPETIEASATEFNDETVAAGAIYHYEFGARGDMPPVTMKWYDGGLMPPRPPELEARRRMGDEGIYFVGDDGILLAGGWAESPRLIPESRMQNYDRPPKTIPRVAGHHRDWIDACKGEGPASGNFDYSGPLTEAVLLGQVALRSGKKIHWDQSGMKAADAPEADELIKPAFRSGWGL